MTIADYKEAFEILAEYDPDAGPQPAFPKHEQINIFVDPNDVPEEDVERLEELGFHAHPEHSRSFPPHFYVFT